MATSSCSYVLGFQRYLVLTMHFFRLTTLSSVSIPTFSNAIPPNFVKNSRPLLSPARNEKVLRRAVRSRFARRPPMNLQNSFGCIITGATIPYSHCSMLTVSFHLRKYDLYRATLEEWTSILKIACTHDFPAVKDFTVRCLESCDIAIAQRIKLYRTFDVDAKYTIPWFVQLCLREEGPTDGETEIMGTKVSLIVYRARERLRSSLVAPNAGAPSPLSESAAIEAICSILGYNSPLSGPGSVSFI